MKYDDSETSTIRAKGWKFALARLLGSSYSHVFDIGIEKLVETYTESKGFTVESLLFIIEQKKLELEELERTINDLYELLPELQTVKLEKEKEVEKITVSSHSGLVELVKEKVPAKVAAVLKNRSEHDDDIITDLMRIVQPPEGVGEVELYNAFIDAVRAT